MQDASLPAFLQNAGDIFFGEKKFLFFVVFVFYF